MVQGSNRLSGGGLSETGMADADTEGCGCYQQIKTRITRTRGGEIWGAYIRENGCQLPEVAEVHVWGVAELW